MKKLLTLLVLSGCFIAAGALGLGSGKAQITKNIYLCLFIDNKQNIWVQGFGDAGKELFTEDPKNLPAGNSQIDKFTHKVFTGLSTTTTTVHVYTCTKKPTPALPFYGLTGANAGIFSDKNDEEKANKKNYQLVGNILVTKGLVSQTDLETALKSPKELEEEKQEKEEELKQLSTPTSYNAYFFLDSTTGALKVLYHIDSNTKKIRIGKLPKFLEGQKLETLGTYKFKFNDKKTVDDELTAYVVVDLEKPESATWYGLTTITEYSILTNKAEREFLAQYNKDLTDAAKKLLEKIKQERIVQERIDIPPEPKKQEIKPTDKPADKPELEPEKSDTIAITNFAVILSKLL